MTDHTDAQHQSIDRAMLTPLVRQALDSDRVEITSWHTQQAHGGATGGFLGSSAIFCISGRGSDDLESMEWSLILKVLYPQPDRDQPSADSYWRREAHVFESGLLDDLPGGLAAAQCYGVVEHPDGQCWIWMEDLKDNTTPVSSLEHYGVVARHLGQFNGAYLTRQRAMPSYPWLRRRSLRDAVARRDASKAHTLAQLHSSLDHPMVRRAYPPDVIDILSRGWGQDRKVQNTLLLNALDRLPQTLCHNDAFERNLFIRDGSDDVCQTVAIDWELVGIGWIGGEIWKLVSHPITDITTSRTEARERDHIVFEGYLEGLRDAGWQRDSRQARFGQIVFRAVLPEGLWLSDLLDESLYVWLEQMLKCSMEEWTDSLRERIRHPLFGYWQEEAWELLEELDFGS